MTKTERQKKNERPPFPAASVIAGTHIGSGDCRRRLPRMPYSEVAATRGPLLVGPVASGHRPVALPRCDYATPAFLRAPAKNEKVGVECGDGKDYSYLERSSEQGIVLLVYANGDRKLVVQDNFNRDFRNFFEAEDVQQQWEAARRLMTNRQFQAASSHPEFARAFEQLAHRCINANGIDQLLAISLTVRISELIKGEIKARAGEVLEAALSKKPDPFWELGQTMKLPVEGKPSEVRENIALALTHATGHWVVPYVVEALAREDRSARCRRELCVQLLARQNSITEWFGLLTKQPWSAIWGPRASDRAARLRDILDAILTTVKLRRSEVAVDLSTGPALALFMQQMVPPSARATRPPRLVDACVICADLLNEILLTDFTLIAEADAYAPIEIISRWWQPASYPSSLALALKNVDQKLASAVRLRARLGQRSETLTARLRQALGSEKSAHELLIEIAETETGLEPLIDDWLRGRERTDSVTAKAVGSLLADLSDRDLTKMIASLLADCTEIMANGKLDQMGAEVKRLLNRIQSLGTLAKLEVQGKIGEIVEFNSAAHRTIDGTIPAEPEVRIVRPMVVRMRDDGSRDVIEHAIVALK